MGLGGMKVLAQGRNPPSEHHPLDHPLEFKLNPKGSQLPFIRGKGGMFSPKSHWHRSVGSAYASQLPFSLKLQELREKQGTGTKLGAEAGALISPRTSGRGIRMGCSGSLETSGASSRI